VCVSFIDPAGTHASISACRTITVGNIAVALAAHGPAAAPARPADATTRTILPPIAPAGKPHTQNPKR